MADNQAIDFESLQIGDTLGPEHLFVGKQHTRLFVRAAHMDSPRFTDDQAARATGLPGAILPGNMSLSLLTKLLTDWIGSADARVVRLGTTYRSPVVTEHTVTLQGFVTHTDPAGGSNPARLARQGDLRKDRAQRLDGIRHHPLYAAQPER